jgi:hypothetical protein
MFIVLGRSAWEYCHRQPENLPVPEMKVHEEYLTLYQNEEHFCGKGFGDSRVAGSYELK